MESNKKPRSISNDVSVHYRDEISTAYERAVREALAKHKRAGNPVVVERNERLVILPPEAIEIDQ